MFRRSIENHKMPLPKRALFNFASVSSKFLRKSYSFRAMNVNEKIGDYYQKIGNQLTENGENLKPEGWDEAKPFRKIPGPKPFPIIGNMWRYFPGGDLHNIQLIDMFRRFKEQYGNIVCLRGMPNRLPLVFIYDPDNVEKVFRNEGPWPIREVLKSYLYYHNHLRNDIFQEVGGVISDQGEAWFKLRSTINKILMQPRTAEMYVTVMNDVSDELVDNMKHFARNSSKNEMPEYFQHELYKWALELLGEIIYNKRLGCMQINAEQNSEGQIMINMILEMFELIYRLDILPSLWGNISTKDWRRFVEVLDYLTGASQKYIEDSLININPDPNMPDYESSVLVRLSKIDKKIALAMATDMITAGIDTTGKTMASTMYLIAKHPEIQEKLQDELKKTMPSKNTAVTKELLKQMPYLKAIIKESTRIAPVATAHVRRSIKDMVIEGYQIPKGIDIVTTNIILSWDDKYVKRAKEFIPERWLRANTADELFYKHIHSFVSLPFGFGPRSCVGKRLASLELEIGLAKIFRNFRLSWNYPDATFSSELLYGINDPLKFTINEVSN